MLAVSGCIGEAGACPLTMKGSSKMDTRIVSLTLAYGLQKQFTHAHDRLI